MYRAVILISSLYSVLLWQEKTLLGDDEAEYPNGHLKYMKNIQKRQFCSVEDHCHKPENISKHCWGYEKGCEKEYAFQYPTCDKPTDGSKESNPETFWQQGGFGYVKKILDSMNIFCEPKEEGNSSFKYSELKCSENWQYCTATNIFIDFADVKFSEDGRERYNGDFLAGNRIGGSCHLKKDLIEKPVPCNGELCSWNAELSHYSVSDHDPFRDCDEIIEKPTFFMKLDSGFNMYHHFCDFLNLYISQHMYGNFSTDVYIVSWDASIFEYWDKLFGDIWKVFSKYPIKRLMDFNGKKVCFKNAVFAMLPRMFDGLYYNTFLVPGCRGGGILKAFSEHVLHRLGIYQEDNQNGTLRVTLLKRSTQFRNIVNQDELIAAMEALDGVKLTVVDYGYKKIPFLEQLKITHNSDIFIGIHGAGLTHIIFQPDWGAAFEIYNTEDTNCYKDLARLRGLFYLTWEDEDLISRQEKGQYPKFTNYAFDVKEFMLLLSTAIKIVKSQTKSTVQGKQMH